MPFERQKRFFVETGAETMDAAREKVNRVKALCGRASCSVTA